MFIQVFSNYLVDNGVLTAEKKNSILKEVNDTRVRMGTIAVADGLMTEEQAEEVNHIQTQQDRRFGDIAVEMGYLTDGQIGQILNKQGDEAMKFFQLFSDKENISMSDVEKHVKDFQKAQGLTDDELEAMKNDDLDKIISLFAVASDQKITDLASLVMRNITRFVTTDFYFGRMKKNNDYKYSVLAGQKSKGDFDVYLGFASESEFDGFINLAKGYARGVKISGSDEIYDAICEFSNMSNGLFASEFSGSGMYIDMEPTEVFLDQQVKGNTYVMPIFIHDKELKLVISVDDEFKPGDNPHVISIKKQVITDINADAKAKVLVADDSSLIRKILSELLRKNGYMVIGEAVNGQEAIEMYDKLKPDILTLDVTMPVMDGVTALKKIREKHPDSNIVMITAAGQKEKVLEALKLGAAIFVTKPLDEREVIKCLEELV